MSQTKDQGELLSRWYSHLLLHLWSDAHANFARLAAGSEQSKSSENSMQSHILHFADKSTQCDEAQPNCRNCAKSKRDCLGYDTFHSKAQPGHPNIKPAPSTSPNVLPAIPTVLSNLYQAYPGTATTFAPHPPSVTGPPSSLQPFYTRPGSAPPGRESSSPNMTQRSPATWLQPIRRGETAQ
jgi:hypothetical protein